MFKNYNLGQKSVFSALMKTIFAAIASAIPLKIVSNNTKNSSFLSSKTKFKHTLDWLKTIFSFFFWVMALVVNAQDIDSFDYSHRQFEKEVVLSNQFDKVKESNYLKWIPATETQGGWHLYIPAFFNQSVFQSKFIGNLIFFNKQVSFSETIFRDDFSVFMGKFGNEVYFSRTQFLGKESNFKWVVFNQKTDFTKAHFLSKENNFNSVSFHSGVSFFQTQFSGLANFENAAFYGRDTKFDQVKFDYKVNFLKAEFKNTVSFRDARFSEESNFNRAVFSKKTDFTKALFLGKTNNFKQARFDKGVNFSQTQFSDSANFENASFAGYTKFDKVTFKGNVDFYDAKFENTVSFSGASFLGASNFVHITLPDTLILDSLGHDDARLSLDITRPMKRSSPCKLYLNHTNLNKVIINYAHFDLCFDGYPNQKAYLSYEEKKQVFEALIDQQKTYDFPVGLAKAQEDYEEFKEMHKLAQQQHNSNKTYSIIGIALLLVLLLYLTIRRNNKAKTIQVTPPIPKVKYKLPVIVEPFNHHKLSEVVLAQIQESITQGEVLWNNYQSSEDTINDIEEFWQAYEKLLVETKRIKQDS